ncbi:uncharacterized protein LOC106660269 [Trichogramma pretiosum]|uniref:uncharacterized protein LOC106660269 n=1 Tax=Trichogramma pretiosum TaxID=7493 RepID=UPI000C71A471|nr:uncharacterized protein LOC106660269 [Trichogramma pretiosum]
MYLSANYPKIICYLILFKFVWAFDDVPKNDNKSKLKNIDFKNNEECISHYSSICARTDNKDHLKNYQFEKRMNDLYLLSMNAFKNYLKDEKIDRNIKPLAVEHTLFKNCMKLENDLDEDEYYTMDGMFESILHKFHQTSRAQSWLKEQEMLAAFGFEYTFFNINIGINPKNPKQSIIVLEPPLVEDWKAKKLINSMKQLFINLQFKTRNYCKKVLHFSFKENQNSGSGSITDDFEFFGFDDETDVDNNTLEFSWSSNINENKNAIDLLCQPFVGVSKSAMTKMIIAKKDRDAIELLEEIVEAVHNTKNVYPEKSTYKLLTIKSWNEMYYEVAQQSTAQINWLKVLKDKLKFLGISTNDDDLIIVKNKPYFFKLATILRDYSMEEIDYAMRSKIVAENLRYLNWNLAQSIDPIEKPEFCFQETKLYGLSDIVFKVFKEELMLKSRIPLAQKVLSNIYAELRDEIYASTQLTKVKKEFLAYELKAIIRDIFSNESNYDLILFYYDKFHVSGNYFVDIINYRRIMGEMKFRKLQKNLSSAKRFTPFSVAELENPRNRFVLHNILSLFLVPSETDEETYYATYGIKLTGLLIAFLHENPFERNMPDFHDFNVLLPNTTHRVDDMQCLMGLENVKDLDHNSRSFINKIITEALSINIAKEAIKRNWSQEVSIQNLYESYFLTQCDSTMYFERDILVKFICDGEFLERNCTLSLFGN